MNTRFSPLTLGFVLTAALFIASFLGRNGRIPTSESLGNKLAPAPELNSDTPLAGIPTSEAGLFNWAGASSRAELPREDELSLDTITGLAEGGSETVPSQVLAERWANLGFDQMLQHLQAVTDGPMWAAHDLELWLVAHPEDGPAAVLESLQGTTNDWILSGLLVQALARAESTSARQALVSVLSQANSYPPTVSIQAAMAAGSFGANADVDVKEALLQLVDSPLADGEFRLSDAALSALGRLAKDDAAFQPAMVERFTPWLKGGASVDETVKAFSALADAVVDQPELVSRAVELTQSTDEKIRAAAERYLASVGRASDAALDQPRSGS